MIDLKSLQFFIAVCEEKSYSRAAIRLKVTQPAVSRRIHSLEDEIGLTLVNREGNGIAPTHHGSLLLEQARELIQKSAGIVETVRATAETPQGSLVIGTPPAAGEFLIPAALKVYMAKFNRVSIRVVEGYTDSLVERLILGEIDIAIVYGDVRESSIILDAVTDLKLGVVAPRLRRKAPDRTISLRDAVALPLILPNRRHGLRKLVEAACSDHGYEPNVVLEADNLVLAKALVLAGLGYTIYAHSGIQSEASKGAVTFRQIVDPSLHWSMSIAIRRNAERSLAIVEMQKVIREEIVKSVKIGRWS